MGVVGTLLKNRRAGETHLAWNLPSLSGPQTLEVTSAAFADGAAIPVESAGRRAGGLNLSPQLAWGTPPAGTSELLLVVEDVDAPMGTPFVHCVALIAPDVAGLAPGALAAQGPGEGVRVPVPNTSRSPDPGAESRRAESFRSRGEADSESGGATVGQNRLRYIG